MDKTANDSGTEQKGVLAEIARRYTSLPDRKRQIDMSMSALRMCSGICGRALGCTAAGVALWLLNDFIAGRLRHCHLLFDGEIVMTHTC